MREFIDDMAKAGLAPANPSAIQETGGKFKRYQTKEDKKKDPTGYYRLTVKPDGFAVGQYGSHRWGETFTWFNKPGKDVSLNKEEFKERRLKEEQELENERRNNAMVAANRARGMYRDGEKVSSDHPYFTAKEVKPAGDLRQAGGNIIVPVWVGGRISNIQTVSGDGDKKFLKFGEVSGGFFPIINAEDKKTTFIICEGLATGLTIREATDTPTIVAFNAANLRPVAEDIRKKYPSAKIIIASDNDQWRLNPKIRQTKKLTPPDEGDDPLYGEWRESEWLENIGLNKAKEAAAAVGGFCMLPDVPADDVDKRTDFNDVGVSSTADTFERTMARSRQAVSQQPDKKKRTVKMDWRDDIVYKGNDRAKGLEPGKALHNSIVMLSHSEIFGGCFAFNEFEQQPFIVAPLPWEKQGEGLYEPRIVEDSDRIRTQAYLEKYGARNSKQQVADAIKIAAEEQSFHPVRDYFLSIEWDGKPRLDTWLIDYASATEQESDYVKTVGRCWIMGCVKRILKPGSLFQNMLVLEGGQGLGKSTLLKTLATVAGREFFTDQLDFSTIKSPSGLMMVQGTLIVEMQELEGLDSSGINRVKGFIGLSSDKVQPKFLNDIVTMPRQFVLAGSTNRSQWYDDETGGRRFWPIKVCGMMDIEGLEAIKDQLWAEAVSRVQDGEKYWVKPDDDIYNLFQSEQSERQLSDPWDNIVYKFLQGKDIVDEEEILVHVLDIPRERWSRAIINRVKSILTRSGYEKKPKWCNKANKTIRRWVRTAPEHIRF